MPRPPILNEALINSEYMLNTAGFAEFLTRVATAGNIPIEDVVADKVNMSERFAMFMDIDKTSALMTKVFEDSVKKELGIQIVISGGKSEIITKYLETLAIESPEQFTEYAECTKRSMELQEKTKAINDEMNKLGGVEKLKATYEDKAKQGITWMGRILWPEVGENIDKAKGIMEKINTAETTRTSYEEKRKELLGRIVAISGIQNEIIAGAQTKLSELFNNAQNSKDLSKFKDLRSYYDKVKQVQEKSGINILTSPFEEEKVKEAIDRGVELLVKTKISESIKAHTLGSKTFDKLESTIRNVINNDVRGMKNQEEMKSFIIDSINEIMNGPDSAIDNDPEKAKAKKILINTLLLKLQD